MTLYLLSHFHNPDTCLHAPPPASSKAQSKNSGHGMQTYTKKPLLHKTTHPKENTTNVPPPPTHEAKKNTILPPQVGLHKLVGIAGHGVVPRTVTNPPPILTNRSKQTLSKILFKVMLRAALQEAETGRNIPGKDEGNSGHLVIALGSKPTPFLI